MTGHGRPAWKCLLWAALLAPRAALAAEPAHTGPADSASRASQPGEAQAKESQPSETPPNGSEQPNVARADAQLHAVSFVDLEQGWAVGDRGVIWHTPDGGRTWQLQTAGVDCSLESVQFIDALHGWAAGGYTHPYTHATTGVLLYTRDGGEHWLRDAKLLLPALRKVKFFDLNRGWAIGQSSALFPAGVFTTSDGGRSWSTLPASAEASWLCGDFVDAHSGLLGGRSSALATVDRRGIESSSTADFGLRAVQGIRLSSPREAWLVGDGGLVRHTTDRGKTWQPPATDLPAGTETHFDFLAVTSRREHCWLAGRPGTQVLHTADSGQSWQRLPTGQNLPIHDLCFVDAEHGWAVGELGLILATSDGGRSWQRQQAGGARAALVGVFGRAQEVPLELFARLSADEGFLGVVEILNRYDHEARRATQAEAPSRNHEALIRAGGSAAVSAWQFPVRQSELRLSAERLVDDWNRVTDHKALEQLDAYLVRELRTWRPAVVVTSASGLETEDTAARLIGQAVLQAVERAADPARHSDQIEEAGLKAWQVDKVFVMQTAGQNGTANITTTQISARSGRSLAELAGEARGLLFDRPREAPTSLGFRLVLDRLPQAVGRGDFFSGISLPPGGEARRALRSLSDESIGRSRRAAQARRNLQAVFGRPGQTRAAEDRWLGEIGQLTRQMDDSSAAEVLFELGQRYHRRGRSEMAAESFDLLVKRYPQHLLSSAAGLWLVQYYASGETSWRAQQRQQIQVQQVSAVEPLAQTLPLEPAGVRSTVSQQAGLIAGLSGSDQRSAKAIAYARQLEQTQPGLFAEPQVRFALSIAERLEGTPRATERFFLGMRRGRQHDAWWAAAESEAWINQRHGPAPKSLATCRHAKARPKLDGQLDEPLWQAAEKFELHSPARDDADWPATVLIARDEEFLYLAASCRQAAGAEYPAGQGRRPRDADLSHRDRLEFCLDIDRDWTSWYQFSVDHRGWTRDACFSDTSWNPQWYVAAQSAEGDWTAECAIPLAELRREQPAAGQVWAMGVTRVVPGVGYQAWNSPAAVEPVGEGFGLLVFD